MKSIITLFIFVLLIGYSHLSYSVTNQELMDRLDDLELDQMIRDQRRQSERSFDKLMELQKQESVSRTRTNLQDIYLNNHVLIYSSPDKRVYMDQKSNKTKTLVYYVVENLNPISNLPNVRYTDMLEMIDCNNNTIRKFRILMLDQNFNELKVSYRESSDTRKIKDRVDTSIKNYMCLR